MPKRNKASEGAQPQEPLIEADEVNTPPGMTKPTPEGVASMDPFDPINCAVSATASENIGIRRVLTSIRVGKPRKQAFVRASTNPKHTIGIALIELESDGETYMVVPAVAAQIPQETIMCDLTLAVDAQQNPFLWQTRQKNPDQRDFPAHVSLRSALAVAQKHWVKVRWNQGEGGYDVDRADGLVIEPKFPDLSMAELLRLAFANRLINEITHPVLQQLLKGHIG